MAESSAPDLHWVPVWVRLAVGAFLSLVGAAQMWLIVSVSEVSARTAVVELQLQHVRADTARIWDSANDRYRGVDAARDFKVRDEALRELQQRVLRLESRPHVDSVR